MEIGKMTISEAEPYLESIAIFYGLENKMQEQMGDFHDFIIFQLKHK
jgi:hypothetical protein